MTPIPDRLGNEQNSGKHGRGILPLNDLNLVVSRVQRGKSDPEQYAARIHPTEMRSHRVGYLDHGNIIILISSY